MFTWQHSGNAENAPVDLEDGNRVDQILNVICPDLWEKTTSATQLGLKDSALEKCWGFRHDCFIEGVGFFLLRYELHCR